MRTQSAWSVHPVDHDCRVRVTRSMPLLPAAVEAVIDRHWADAQADTGGKLFNGAIFSADIITPGLICGHWSEYRRTVAQMRDPALHAVLGVRSLAVGGVLISPDGVVFGRRPPRAVYQAGEWQLPPAGTVDRSTARADARVDVRAQFLTELREELGIEATCVSDLRLLCIVEHAGSHVLDLGIAARTGLRRTEILDRHARLGDGEYDPVTVVPVADIPAFLAAAGTLLNLQAPAFLRRALSLD